MVDIACGGDCRREPNATSQDQTRHARHATKERTPHCLLPKTPAGLRAWSQKRDVAQSGWRVLQGEPLAESPLTSVALTPCASQFGRVLGNKLFTVTSAPLAAAGACTRGVGDATATDFVRQTSRSCSAQPTASSAPAACRAPGLVQQPGCVRRTHRRERQQPRACRALVCGCAAGLYAPRASTPHAPRQPFAPRSRRHAAAVAPPPPPPPRLGGLQMRRHSRSPQARTPSGRSQTSACAPALGASRAGLAR